MKCSCGLILKSNGCCPSQKCPWFDRPHPEWVYPRTRLAKGGVFYEMREGLSDSERMSKIAARYLRP